MIKTFPIYYPLYQNTDKFIILITGGRGSGKSFSTSTFLERLTFEMTSAEKIVHQILYTRYTMVSANISIIPEFLERRSWTAHRSISALPGRRLSTE